jgi:soluble lytic murein transglycosylase-like protein
MELTQKQLKVAKQIKDPLLIAIAMQESRLDPNALSHDGGVGAFQITHGVDRKEKRKLLSSLHYQKTKAIEHLMYWSDRRGGKKIDILSSYNGGSNYRSRQCRKYALNVIKYEQVFKNLKKQGVI